MNGSPLEDSCDSDSESPTPRRPIDMNRVRVALISDSDTPSVDPVPTIHEIEQVVSAFRLNDERVLDIDSFLLTMQISYVSQNLYHDLMDGVLQEPRAASIRELSVKEEQELKHVLKKIARSPCLLDADGIQYISCRSKIDTYGAILAPVRRLPPEIVSEIFLLLMWSRHFGDVVHNCTRKEEPFSLRPYTDPLMICHICPSWRQIALGYSSLWTNIHLYFTPRNSRSGDALNAMTTWIDRTKSTPFSIKISAESQDVSFDGIIKALIPRISTCRSFTVSAPPVLFDQLDLSTLLSGPLPLLGHLTLSVKTDPRTSFPFEWDPSSTPFNDAPRLRAIHISEVRLPDLESLMFPWSQLVDLSLDCVEYDRYSVETLRHCVNLENLHLFIIQQNNSDRPDAFASSSPAVLPKLSSLTLIIRTHVLQYILQSLTLPVLDKLSITAISHIEPGWPASEFSELQVRSAFTLTDLQLRLNWLSLPPHGFITLLRTLPSLKKLSSHCCGCDNAFFRALSYSAESPNEDSTLLPRLQDLTVVEDGEFDDTEVASMIESRWWTVQPTSTRPRLKHVFIAACEYPSGAVQDRLAKCRKGGLQVVYTSLPGQLET